MSDRRIQTLTTGRPEVTEGHPAEMSDRRIQTLTTGRPEVTED